MNGLTVFNHDGRLVVDSRQVAEMVGKEHKNLLQDIRGYIAHFAELKSQPSKNDSKYVQMAREMFERTHGNIDKAISDFFIPHTYRDSTGRTLPCYLLTRKGCDMVANKMTGEKGVLFTAAYVTKFEEMEKQLEKPFQVPQSFPEALRLAADLAEKNQKLLPKAEQFDKFISGKNYQTINIAAKTLGIGRNKLFRLLRDRRILMKNNAPYQQYIDAGYFVVKEKPIQMGDQVINKPQTYATPKGIAWLDKLLTTWDYRRSECG